MIYFKTEKQCWAPAKVALNCPCFDNRLGTQIPVLLLLLLLGIYASCPTCGMVTLLCDDDKFHFHVLQDGRSGPAD